MANRIAVSLAPPDTGACLAALRDLAPDVGMAEVRLDLMGSFDLPRLVRESPLPLIITCRPPREGGRFAGSEAERLDILSRAFDLGCAFVDVEWDSVAAFAGRRGAHTRLIASRHWSDDMPARLWPAYEELSRKADAVKLVGMARRASDVLPVFDLLSRAGGPVVGIAMGEAGRVTRLLAPCFAPCLLTYGAQESGGATAPGQLTVREMVDLYHLNAVGPHTAVELHLCGSADSCRAVVERNADVTPGEVLHVPLLASSAEARTLAVGLRACLPRLALRAEPPLSPADFI
ncbi:MAG TPA: type I 3-dehydroquinate dehydratase [Pyrinomonadaceae bacterium]|jgi:3-dehydroquinate dehydratase/shikimate dehydrogenase